jgi:hypothetical protein
MSLAELIAPGRRVAFIGLAKNTGKTETLKYALRELQDSGLSVGVTSVGRDGEERDALDMWVEKPRIELPTWSLVATTDTLLRSAAVAHELLLQTDFRTPLGRVVVARMLAGGSVEIAGPSAAEDVRAVVDAMLAYGAEQVLIDGAVDRRAASSPDVSDSLVMSTGAVLNEEIETVVSRTRDAVDLVRLVELSDRLEIGQRIRAIAASYHGSVLVGPPGEEPILLPPRFALASTNHDIAELLHAHPSARHLIVRGALCERFLKALVRVAHGRALQIIVADSTKVFLPRRSYEWYERMGISIRVLAPLHLRALTVNPIAPRAHRFDSRQLRALLEQAIADLPILDVRDRAHQLIPAA